MAKHTKRDQVWNRAIKSVYRDGEEIRHSEIAEKIDVSDKTARETLKTMAENEFLSREVREGNIVYVAHPEGI